MSLNHAAHEPLMILLWTPRALRDVAAVLERIATEDPGAASRFNERLLTLVETTLTAQPFIGRPGRVSETRELVVHSSYILVYRVKEETIEILAFRHAARLWPERF
jgi:toxin ParE1/3/4